MFVCLIYSLLGSGVHAYRREFGSDLPLWWQPEELVVEVRSGTSLLFPSLDPQDDAEIVMKSEYKKWGGVEFEWYFTGVNKLNAEGKVVERGSSASKRMGDLEINLWKGKMGLMSRQRRYGRKQRLMTTREHTRGIWFVQTPDDEILYTIIDQAGMALRGDEKFGYGYESRHAQCLFRVGNFWNVYKGRRTHRTIDKPLYSMFEDCTGADQHFILAADGQPVGYVRDLNADDCEIHTRKGGDPGLFVTLVNVKTRLMQMLTAAITTKVADRQSSESQKLQVQKDQLAAMKAHHANMTANPHLFALEKP